MQYHRYASDDGDTATQGGVRGRPLTAITKSGLQDDRPLGKDSTRVIYFDRSEGGCSQGEWFSSPPPPPITLTPHPPILPYAHTPVCPSRCWRQREESSRGTNTMTWRSYPPSSPLLRFLLTRLGVLITRTTESPNWKEPFSPTRRHTLLARSTGRWRMMTATRIISVGR